LTTSASGAIVDSGANVTKNQTVANATCGKLFDHFMAAASQTRITVKDPQALNCAKFVA
jgi:hypothetical protein